MSDPDHSGEMRGGEQGAIIEAMLLNLLLRANALNLEIEISHDNRVEVARMIEEELNKKFPDPEDRVAWGSELRKKFPVK